MPRGGRRPGAGAPKGNRNARYPAAVILTGACYTGRHDRCGRLGPEQDANCQCRCHRTPTPGP